LLQSAKPGEQIRYVRRVQLTEHCLQLVNLSILDHFADALAKLIQTLFSHLNIL